jgi:hypothetical protein
MAVAAERLHPQTQFETYQSLDMIPEIAEARQEVRDDAWAMVRARERQLEAGDDTLVPLSIDALSTADRVLEAGSLFGKNSVEYEDKLAGLEKDCLRLVAEWYRKKRPEYFPASRHFFDADTGDFYSHGLSIRQMTENALRPIDNDPEEVGRRVNERVEDATPLIMKKLGGFALNQVGIRTISECTDKAINDYQQDIKDKAPHRGYGGYVPEIEKVMIRDMRFDEQTGDRLEEQIGLPGIYITHDVIQQALRRRGVKTGTMCKTELHGTQLLVEDDLMDFVKLLDTVASEDWCVDIFMGEHVPKGSKKDYDVFREQALQRQESIKDLADTVAVFVMDLADDNYDRRKAPAKVEEFVKMLLLDMAKQDITLATQMFDDKTAAGLQQVRYLEANNRSQEAFELYKQVSEAAPGGGYCSGGSCGLEAVNKMSGEGLELAKKVKAQAGDTVVKDKERACKCGKKDIVYAYNKVRVNKFCNSCGAFESKASRVTAG